MKFNPQIITLYRYFGYAAQMRSLFVREMSHEWLEMMGEDPSGLVLFLCSEPGMYLLYSYAGIYLVIEGYRDLRLADKDIDALLASPYVERLRRFRNATFHYQPDILSWKHLEFFGTEEEKTEQWLGQLYAAFERFFAENTLPLPDKLRKSLRGKSAFQVKQEIRDFWNAQC